MRRPEAPRFYCGLPTPPRMAHTMMDQKSREYVWKWAAVTYYALAIIFRPGMTCHFPWQVDDLVLFGVVPGLASVAGLTFCKTRTGRITSRTVFVLAIAGVALSFVPWSQAIGFR